MILDAEGDLTQILLERMPHEALERLVVVDPSDGEYPYSWNPADDFRALPAAAAVPTLADTLASVYQCEDGPLTTRAAEYLLAHPDATFLFLYNATTDPKARERLLPRSSAEREPFEQALAQSADAIVSIKEYGQYLGKDTLMRNILGQSVSKFTLASLKGGLPAQAGGIVVVDFSRIKMFPTRVTPLVRLILSAARAEAELALLSGQAPVAVYLYDCLRYLSEQNMERALLDRNIALTVSDASHGEEGALREKLLQRAGTVAAFAPQEEDVHMTGRAFYPYVASEELEKLDDGELIIALAIDSVRSRPFFASAFPSGERSGVSAQDVRLASRTRYAISRPAADKLFKPQKEEPEKKKEDDPGSFSGAFRSIFSKRPDGSAPSATPKPAELKTPPPFPSPSPLPAAPKASEKEKKPNVEGIVRNPPPAPPPAGGPSEIPEKKLKKMLRVGKPPRP
jgi:hypothetical protein